MKTITKAQLTAIHTLLSKKRLTDDKRSIIAHYTGGRTQSSREMSFEEAKQLISFLSDSDNEVKNVRAEKMRKKIIYYAHEMNWKTPTGKADMSRINAWCIKSGYLKKELDDYSYEELPKLVSQFEQVYKTYIS